jgi:hypothetical protein
LVRDYERLPETVCRRHFATFSGLMPQLGVALRMAGAK